MSDNTYPWWVTSDPDHPVNAAAPIPEVPLMSEPEFGASSGENTGGLEEQVPMPRLFSDTVAARAAVDPEFRQALAEEPMVPAVEAPDAPWMPPEHEAEPLTPPLPDHVAEALHVAQTPGISDAEREAAVRVLLTFEADHKPVSDAHPSSIPDDLIPAQYQAKAEGAPL